MSYPYPYSPSGLYILARDGKPLFRDTEQACWAWLHRHHGFSVEHALRHEGYSMTPDDGSRCMFTAEGRDDHERQQQGFQAEEEDGWAVYHKGRKVLSGESYVVASNVLHAIQTGAHGVSECHEVARAILGSTEHTQREALK